MGFNSAFKGLIWAIPVCLQGNYKYKILGPDTAVFFFQGNQLIRD